MPDPNPRVEVLGNCRTKMDKYIYIYTNICAPSRDIAMIALLPPPNSKKGLYRNPNRLKQLATFAWRVDSSDIFRSVWSILVDCIFRLFQSFHSTRPNSTRAAWSTILGGQLFGGVGTWQGFEIPTHFCLLGLALRHYTALPNATSRTFSFTQVIQFQNQEILPKRKLMLILNSHDFSLCWISASSSWCINFYIQTVLLIRFRYQGPGNQWFWWRSNAQSKTM